MAIKTQKISNLRGNLENMGYNELGYYEDRKLDKALFSFGQFLKTRFGSRLRMDIAEEVRL